MAVRRRAGAACALVAALALLAGCCAQGRVDFSQATPNPFQGQNLPPVPVAEYPLQVFALIEDLYEVNEQRYTFSIVFRLLFHYEDPRTVEYMRTDPSDGCAFFCSSEPTDILNDEGKPACCTRAFIPGVQAVNLISYMGQEMPADYQLDILSNTTLAYSSRARGVFSTDLQYEHYPVDMHYFSVDFTTPFKIDPSVGGTFVEGVVAQVVGGASGLSKGPRPSLTAIHLPAWKVKDTRFELMNYTTVYTSGAKDITKAENDQELSELAAKGFRISVEVERTSKGFYVVVEILPVCLIVLFSFCAFTLPIGNVKARFNVLAGQFLTLIVLQFVLYTVLPATFEVIKPYLLICVSYVVTICMCAEVIFVDWLRCRFMRPRTKAQTRKSRDSYRLWRARLQRSPAIQARDKICSLPPVKPGEPGVESSTPSASTPLSDREPSEADLKDAELGRGKLAVAEAQPTADQKRLQRWQRSWIWRHAWLREARLRWLYMGREEGEEYCFYFAKRVDRGCCLVLAVAYVIVVCTIFSLAAANASPNTY